MEVALAGLVGAGLALVYEGLEGAVPDGAVEHGFELIRHISVERPEIGVALTQTIVADIWQGWKQAQLPHDVALRHIQALPRLMDRFRSSDDVLLGGIANARAASRDDEIAAPVTQSAHVASAIIGRATAAGALVEFGLDAATTTFFLERLLARLLPDETLFVTLRPLLLRYVQGSSWQVHGDAQNAVDQAHGDAEETAASNIPRAHPAAAPPASPAAIAGPLAMAPTPTAPSHAALMARIAGEVGVPLAALRPHADAAAARIGALSESWLVHIAEGLKEVLLQLTAPPASHPDAVAIKLQAGRSLAAGDSAAADALLGRAEDVYLRAATLDLAVAHRCLADAADTRAIRAEIEELGGHFRRASRHYANASRCLPDADRKGRRGFLMRQASALAAHGKIANETTALSEAAQVYADAGRLLAMHEAPLDWALAHLDLGRILMQLGNLEGRRERFMAAGQHFKSAADVLVKLDQAEHWSHAQLGLADALKAHGEIQGDIAALSEAAFAYRAALDVINRDFRPREWTGASFRLAATLVRMDQETGGTTHHNEAVVVLRAVLAAPQDMTVPAIRSGAVAMLVQALLTLSRVRGEAWLEEEAISVLRGGQSIVMPTLEAPMRAGLNDHLGAILYAVGARRGHSGLISEAAEMKLAALDYYDFNGQDAQAGRIRGELDAMENAIVQLTGTIAENASA